MYIAEKWQMKGCKMEGKQEEWMVGFIELRKGGSFLAAEVFGEETDINHTYNENQEEIITQ